MSDVFKVGDEVRIAGNILPRLFAAHQKKYTNRTGVVVRKYTPLGARYETIVIKWGKRGNRGKEFEDKWKADDLELAA